MSGSILRNVDPLGLEEQTVDAANAGGAPAADPAEHMGTGHEGASSDGSYLEATSSAEYVDTTQAIVGSATSAGGVAVMAARVSVALALTWAAGNALKVTGDTKCSGADCDGRAGSAMVGSGVTAAVEFKAGLQAAARTSAKPAPEPKVDVQKVSKELDEIKEKVLGGIGSSQNTTASAMADAGGMANPPNRIYSTRVIERMAAEPGPYHNFPMKCDDAILSSGTRTVTDDAFRVPKAGYSNTGVTYTLEGIVNGRSGVFEIGTRLSESGRTELILHRFFRPQKE